MRLAEEYVEHFELVCEVLEEFIDTWDATRDDIQDICNEDQSRDIDDLTDRLFACFRELLHFDDLGEGDEDEPTV